MGRQYATSRQAAAAQAFAGFAPFGTQAVNGRGDNQHHQRNLEIQISQRQANEAENGKAGAVQVEVGIVAQQYRHQTHAAQGGQKGKRQRNTGKVGGYAGEGHQRGANPGGQATLNGRQRQQQADQAAAQRRGALTSKLIQ
jgi:hypothetical protein